MITTECPEFIAVPEMNGNMDLILYLENDTLEHCKQLVNTAPELATVYIYKFYKVDLDQKQGCPFIYKFDKIAIRRIL
jgi:hypothetical protein